MVTKAVDGQCIQDFRVAGRTIELLMISNLLFVDDTLVFCGNDIE